MPAFDYLALDDGGRKQRGVLEADSARQVRQSLRDKGWMPMEVKESASSTRQRMSGGLRVRTGATDLAVITRQLATLVQAALPIEAALAAVAQQTEKAAIRSMLLAVRAKVLEGHSLAKSIEQFPKTFSSLYCATVAAGEQSGHLDKVLERLADYTQESAQARQRMQLAILYPCILLVLSILIVSGLMLYVVPDIVQVFIDSHQELPALTRGLIGLSEFLGQYSGFILLLLVVIWVLAKQALKQPAFKLVFDQKRLALPIIGRVAKGANIARFASTLSILTSSAVPLVEALKIAGAVLNNSWLSAQVATATQQVTEGSSLHAALQQTGAFPPMLVQMIASGESSGELDSLLERAASNQEREVQHSIAVLLGLFEPFMLLLMGGSVLLIVLAILLPIMNINQLVG